MTDHAALTKLTNGKNLSRRMIRWALKLSEFNIEWEHRPGVQNVVTNVLSRNPVGNMDGSQISCAAIRALALNSREQLIQEQREDLELGQIYRYLENPDDGSVNATVCEGPYPTSRTERYRFVLVITDHFTKWSELIPQRKALAQAIANALFENYISRYGAPISVISDNGPQFISEVFEHLSHRLDIKHIKTVTYRPQTNLTERVNRNLVQMIACFVKENHENWDRFLHEFAFALRTSVNETTSKTPDELFSKGSQSIAGPSHQIDSKQGKPPTEGSRNKRSRQYDKARETRTTKIGTNRAAERRPFRSKQATAVKPCPYYLRSRVKQPEGISKERRSIGIDSIPQNNIRRRSLSMEALDRDLVNRSE
ncbi:retrovirus-related Pol polyprotein from transposon 17.6 [Trichonephila clavipes]|nr:retrovirus-related Pol polyprotein from transposon 17.6 [Trichonephila clavipes]